MNARHIDPMPQYSNYIGRYAIGCQPINRRASDSALWHPSWGDQYLWHYVIQSFPFYFLSAFSGVVCICPMMSRRNTQRDLIIRPDGCVSAHAFTDSLSTGLTRGALCFGTPNECFFTIPSAIPVVMPRNSAAASVLSTQRVCTTA